MLGRDKAVQGRTAPGACDDTQAETASHVRVSVRTELN
jgi:hypothetical protein